MKPNSFPTELRTSILILAMTILIGCQTKTDKNMDTMDTNVALLKSDDNREADLSCKLTTPELQHRKATIIEKLKKQTLERRELENGYAFKFSDSDSVMYELSSFIRTEMQCCDFFAFSLIVNKDKGYIWLELTGGTGAKEFINAEMEI